METKFGIKLMKTFAIFLLSSVFCFGQMVPITLIEKIDRSSIVIVGQVVVDSILCVMDIDSVNVPPGLYGFIGETDAEIYSVSIVRLLKGHYSGTSVEILKEKNEDMELLYSLDRSKRYLFFLDTARVDSGLILKYNLQARNFFTPFFGQLGVTELNDQDGINRLRRTEQYLGLSPTPIEIIPLSVWLDSLGILVRQAYNNGAIGDAAFADELNDVINKARNFLLQGDSINCAKEVLKFDNMIKGTFKGFDRMRFVAFDWYSFLSSDALYLRFNLPRIPDGNIPSVDSLNPNKFYAGGAGVTLTITGEDFKNGATVYWNWSPRVTTFISSTQLQANITSADIAKADTATVAVVNPNGATHGAEFIVLPQSPTGCNVKLVNSTGAKLTGSALQYYEGSWKDAVNNNDGTFSIDTKLKTLSLRMTYEYGSQTKSNVSISNDTIVFQTVNAQIQLQNSSGALIDTGSVQYYAGAWRTLGTTTNGVANKELLPNSYSFRMNYAFASKDKQQDIGTNATVVFQTVNAAVQIQNSQGTLMDQGTVQYYSGAWRDLGTTANGVATKELLPNSYSFRMSYAYASKDKQQDISTNATVIFQSVNAAVQLQNSQGVLMDQGTVQYYSGAWRDFGATTNGTANKELLPANYSFRMSYAFASKDKQQDIGINATVVFQTVNAAVQLQNSGGILIDTGSVQYYAGAWRTLGTTINGTATKELLPANYSFRMSYAYASKDKQQDIGTNATVVFQTVNTAVQLKNSLGNLIDQGTVQYYSGAWRTLGATTNVTASKELLPNNYSFRMTYEYVSLDKAQDVATNNIVSFSTVLCTIRVKNSQNQLVDNAMASYYSGAWRQIGNTVSGVITKELLPVNLSFRVKYGTQQQDKQQNLLTNNLVEFAIQ